MKTYADYEVGPLHCVQNLTTKWMMVTCCYGSSKIESTSLCCVMETFPRLGDAKMRVRVSEVVWHWELYQSESVDSKTTSVAIWTYQFLAGDMRMRISKMLAERSVLELLHSN